MGKNIIRQSSFATPGSHRYSNWQRYLELLDRQGVPGRYRRWYVAHVEQFLATFPNRKLSDLNRREITDYLRHLLSHTDVPEWQIRQKVDAIRLLLVDLVQNREALEVDWNYWVEAGLKVIPLDHPTLARELPRYRSRSCQVIEKA